MKTHTRSVFGVGVRKIWNFVPSLEDIKQRSQMTIHETTINSLLLTFARVTLNSEGMFFSQKQPLYKVQAKGQKTLSGRQLGQRTAINLTWSPNQYQTFITLFIPFLSLGKSQLICTSPWCRSQNWLRIARWLVLPMHILSTTCLSSDNSSWVAIVTWSSAIF